MLEAKARLLLILSQDVLDRARVLAGRATTVLKLPVSLQIVLRALIGVGLRRENQPALQASIEEQTRALRDKRSGARRADVAPGERSLRSGTLARRRRRESEENSRRTSTTTSAK